MNMLRILQKQEIIPIREFARRLSEITEKPTSPVYTVTKNGKKVGIFIPEEHEQEMLMEEEIETKEGKTYSSVFDNYEDIAFSGGEKNISVKIDTLLYGKEDTK